MTGPVPGGPQVLPIPGAMGDIKGNGGTTFAVQSLWSNEAAAGAGYCAGSVSLREPTTLSIIGLQHFSRFGLVDRAVTVEGCDEAPKPSRPFLDRCSCSRFPSPTPLITAYADVGHDEYAALSLCPLHLETLAAVPLHELPHRGFCTQGAREAMSEMWSSGRGGPKRFQIAGVRGESLGVAPG